MSTDIEKPTSVEELVENSRTIAIELAQVYTRIPGTSITRATAAMSLLALALERLMEESPKAAREFDEGLVAILRAISPGRVLDSPPINGQQQAH